MSAADIADMLHDVGRSVQLADEGPDLGTSLGWALIAMQQLTEVIAQQQQQIDTLRQQIATGKPRLTLSQIVALGKDTSHE